MPAPSGPLRQVLGLGAVVALAARSRAGAGDGPVSQLLAVIVVLAAFPTNPPTRVRPDTAPRT